MQNKCLRIVLLYQQVLCAKHLKLLCVLEPVVKTIKDINSGGLIHCQFKEFLSDFDVQFPDLPYYTTVLSLSYGKIVMISFELRNEIKIFFFETDLNYQITTGFGNWYFIVI